MWNEKEEEILVHVTRFLPREENLPRQQIIDAVKADKVASAIMAENGGQFSQQQIRDKYKSISRKYKKKYTIWTSTFYLFELQLFIQLFCL